MNPYPVYKDSCIEGLGDIPTHWEVQRLKDVATWNDEALPDSTDPAFEMTYVDIGGVDAVRGIVEKETLTFQIAPSRARRIVRHGDVVISTVRTYLRSISSIINPDPNLIVSTGFAVIRPTRIDTAFASYAIRSPYFVDHVVANSVGVSYPAINANELVSLAIVCPSLTEQRYIAAFLDRETEKIDALVAKKERLIELLQEKRSAFITRAVTKGLNADVSVKDSGIEWLGAIPRHWKLQRLKRLSNEITVGVVVNPSTYVCDEGVPFVYGSDIEEGSIAPDTARRIRKENSEALRKSQLSSGDLLTVRVGAPGVTAVVPPELEGANCASVVIIRRDKSFDSGWLCHVMNSRLVRYQIELVQYGAAQEQFNVAHAVDFFVPQPPLDEQRTLAALLDYHAMKIDALLSDIRRAIDCLKELRAALISAAVTGKIDVREEATANPEPTS